MELRKFTRRATVTTAAAARALGPPCSAAVSEIPEDVLHRRVFVFLGSLTDLFACSLTCRAWCVAGVVRAVEW